MKKSPSRTVLVHNIPTISPTNSSKIYIIKANQTSEEKTNVNHQ